MSVRTCTLARTSYWALVSFQVAVDVVPSCPELGSATELAVASSKAALASAGMDPAMIDATFVGNVIQSRCVRQANLVLLSLMKSVGRNEETATACIVVVFVITVAAFCLTMPPSTT